MTTVAARRETAVLPRTWGDRLLAAVPLASLFLWLCVLYGWQAWGTHTAWFFYDELLYAQLSRAISETGHAALRGHPASFTTLYTFLLAPVWRIRDPHAAYGAAKLVGVLTMAAVVFPAYGLARMVSSRRAALFAAAASALIPSLAYSSLLLSEVVAYPYAALCFLAGLKAMATRRTAWLAAAAGLALVAPLVRKQLLVMPVALALAALIYAATDERARRRLRAASPAAWAGLALAVVATIALADLALARYYGIWSIAVHHHPGHTLEYAVWSLGALTIGLGVLPVVVGLASLVPSRGERWQPARRAFASLLASSVLAFAVYTGVKAAYLATIWRKIVEERNVIYLSPLFFAATAAWVESRRLRLWALAASVVLVAYFIAATPIAFDYPNIEALGLSLLSWAHLHLSLSAGGARAALLVLVAVAAGVVLVVALRPDSRVMRVVAVTAAVVALAWNVAGELAASHYQRWFSNLMYEAMPHPLDWVDRATGGAPTVYLAHQVLDPNGLHLTEFWNRSIDTVANVDGVDYPGPGPVLATRPRPETGAIAPDPGDEYAVAESGIAPVGTPVLQQGTWTLVRLARPLRLRSVQNGVSADGWMSRKSSYAQYSTPGRRSGVLTIAASRTGWQGPDVGGRVVVRLTPGSRRFSKPIHSGQSVVFRVATPRPPFRADVTVTRTFVPAELDNNSTDTRRLGAEMTYAFAPR